MLNHQTNALKWIMVVIAMMFTTSSVLAEKMPAVERVVWDKRPIAVAYSA